MWRPISYRATILAALLLAAALTFPALAPAGRYAELGNNTEASVFAAQPDGKLLLSGSTDLCKPFDDCPDRRLFVARMLRSGQLDPHFGGSEGIAVIPFKGSSARITDASLQANGRIVVVGALWTDEGATSFAARLMPNGRLDRSFGSAGRVELPINIPYYGGVAIDRQGRIIVAGSRYPDFAVTALLPSGRLDKTFGTDGVATAHFSPAALFDEAEGLEILSGNRILVSGTSEKISSESYIGLAQLLPDGSLDPSFGGGDGLAIGPGIRGQTGDDPGTDRSGGSPIVTDDSITIVGHAGRSGMHQCPSGLITRFDRDGVWDPSYGSAGTRLFRCTSGFRGTATADRHLLVSGTADFYDLSYPRIGRFDADGNADREFSRGAGLRRLRPAGLQGWGTGLIARGNSAFFSASMLFDNCSRSEVGCQAVTVTKLNADGSLDRSFGTAGVASFPTLKICRRHPLKPC